MSVLDKFLNVMRLNPDDDDDFYNEDYDYDDDYEEDEPVKSKSSFRKDKRKAEEDDYEEDHSIHEKAVKSSPKVTPIRPVKKQGEAAWKYVSSNQPQWKMPERLQRRFSITARSY